MFNIFIAFLSILFVGFTSQASAKGLNDLAAGQAKEEVKVEKKKTEVKTKILKKTKQKIKKSVKEVVAEPTKATSEASVVIPRKPGSLPLTLVLGFGWAGLSKDSTNWRTSAVTDLSAYYRLPAKLMSQNLYATFRYTAMDVAPQLSEGDIKVDYVGAVNGYHFGAAMDFPFMENFVAKGMAEIGAMTVSLDSVVNAPGALTPEDTEFIVTLGGGFDWLAMPGFYVGPRAHIGFGGFTSTQLSGAMSFVF